MENKNSDDMAEYLKMTGQTEQELFGGVFSYGFDFILNELVPKAIKEKKKIVWKDDLTKLDCTTYSLEDI